MTQAADFDVANAFARVARDIAGQDDLAATTTRVVQLAKQTLYCRAAAVWQLSGADCLKLDACTDPDIVAGIHDLKARTGQGLAWECLRERTPIRSDDLSTETRWPDYTRWVLQHSQIRSAVGYPLEQAGRHLGALVLYSQEPGFFNDTIMRAGEIYAAHAGIALSHAISASKAAHLERALASNRRIGMAVGILMYAHRITDEQAFDLMRTISQHTDQKVREVADYVVSTGELPACPPTAGLKKHA
jgi:GAF domain-containing protein